MPDHWQPAVAPWTGPTGSRPDRYGQITNSYAWDLKDPDDVADPAALREEAEKFIGRWPESTFTVTDDWIMFLDFTRHFTDGEPTDDPFVVKWLVPIEERRAPLIVQRGNLLGDAKGSRRADD